MANKCELCTEKCPQAERAHQAALGRMYATNELMALLKKMENGELVEVVRCKDCKHYEDHKRKVYENCVRNDRFIPMKPDDFCSYGERREGE